MQSKRCRLVFYGLLSIGAAACQLVPVQQRELPSFTWPNRLRVDVHQMNSYYKSDGPGCAITITAANLSEQTIEPSIRLVLLDQNGNTLDQAVFSFPPINAGKTATREGYGYQTSCSRVARVEARAGGLN